MGTMSTIAVPPHESDRYGRSAAESAVRAARRSLEGMDLRFSHYRDDSEITRWQRGETLTVDAVADIQVVLAECARLAADSDGVFVPRNPRTGALDTAGFVKGYAIERAAGLLRSAGLGSFAVSVGGDGYFAGQAAPGRAWQVAIQDPSRRYGVASVVAVVDGAVATSGTRERGEHIWAGEGERAAGPVASFTVVGPSIAEADAYATVGFAMGDAGSAWVAQHEGYRSIAIRTDGSIATDAALVSAG